MWPLPFVVNGFCFDCQSVGLDDPVVAEGIVKVWGVDITDGRREGRRAELRVAANLAPLAHLTIEVVLPEPIVVILRAVERVANPMVEGVCEVVAAATAFAFPGIVGTLDGLQVSARALAVFHQSVEVAFPEGIPFLTAAESLPNLIIVLLHAEIKALVPLVVPFPLGILQPPLVELAQFGMERSHAKEREGNREGACDRRAIHDLSFLAWLK